MCIVYNTISNFNKFIVQKFYKDCLNLVVTFIFQHNWIATYNSTGDSIGYIILCRLRAKE